MSRKARSHSPGVLQALIAAVKLVSLGGSEFDCISASR